MTQFPDLGRLFQDAQLWHQFLSHFPFVLWVVASVLFVVSLSFRFHWLHLPSLVMGVLGSAFGGLSWYTGDALARGAAKGVFARSLVSEHQLNAHTALVAFTAVFGVASLVRLAKTRYPNLNADNTWIRGAFVVGLAFASFYLFVSTQEGVRLARQKQTYLRGEVINAR